MRIISAPFGNYLHRPGWVSTTGTFTFRNRGGLLWRLWRCARTLRYDREHGGWINRLGLPNPGAAWLANHAERMNGTILSLTVARDEGIGDWGLLLTAAAKLCKPLAWEINASCPNEERGTSMQYLISMAAAVLHPEISSPPIYIKLPPTGFERTVMYAAERGIKGFHCCNTFPTARGGLSGPWLRPYVRRALEWIRRSVPDCTLIAGGGIQCAGDAEEYYDLGANHVAVGSAWFNPFRWKKLDLIRDQTRNPADYPRLCELEERGDIQITRNDQDLRSDLGLTADGHPPQGYPREI